MALSSQICDFPFAVMDARTFAPEDQIPNHLHINFLAFVFNNLNGAVSHNPEQRWYYYAMQRTSEVLVFHHYTKVRNNICIRTCFNKILNIYCVQDKWLVNPHTGFKNTNCPRGTETRVSAELRVALFF